MSLPRVMGLKDVVFFNIAAIVGTRWLTTAASQFGLASLLLWVVAMVIFFFPCAMVVRELADIDPGAGGIYRWVHRAFGARQGHRQEEHIGGHEKNRTFDKCNDRKPTFCRFPGGERNSPIIEFAEHG